VRSKITKKRDEQTEKGNREIIERRKIVRIYRGTCLVSPSIIQVAQLTSALRTHSLINSLYVFVQRWPTYQMLSATKHSSVCRKRHSWIPNDLLTFDSRFSFKTFIQYSSYGYVRLLLPPIEQQNGWTVKIKYKIETKWTGTIYPT